MCIFCDIIDGKIPSSKVYEDDNTLSFLDLSQTTYGHTLVIPKKHYDNVLQMRADEFAELMKTVQKVAKMLQEKLNYKGVNILINTNEEAGQTVKHAHVHIIPRYDVNDTVKFEFTENNTDLNEVLSKIKG